MCCWDRNFKKYLWTEAVLAVYVVNRSLTSALESCVPAEKWFEKKQDVSKLRVFGCLTYIRILTELVEGKFDSRTEKCYMVEYCPNGYRLWNPANKKILLGRDVKFVETKFVNSKELTDYLETDSDAISEKSVEEITSQDKKV